VADAGTKRSRTRSALEQTAPEAPEIASAAPLPVFQANSLITGKITGNFQVLASFFMLVLCSKNENCPFFEYTTKV
jgi:hypothetical protein